MVLDSLSASDRANLLEVYARTVMLLDMGHADEWAHLLEAGAVVHGARGQREPAGYEFKGRQELLRLAREIVVGRLHLAMETLNPSVRTHHTLNNVCLYTEGAHHPCGYAHVTVTTVGGDEAPRWLGAGIYSDRLTKNGSGCWLFHSRVFTPEGVGLAPAGSLARKPSPVRQTG